MKKILTAIIAVCFSTIAFAQENYQPGYIVTANGDTVKGTINNLLWRESPTEISFTGASGLSKYKPQDILAFGAGAHTFYRSFNVKIDTTGGVGGDKAKSSAPTFDEKHVFLQIIVDSKYSLLKYRSGFSTHFFIQERNQVPEELISHTSTLLIASRTLTQPGNQFIAKLKEKMNDCPSLKIDTEMKYMEGTLTEVFEEYSKCKSDKAVTPGDEPTNIYFGVVAAAHYDVFSGNLSHGIGYSGGAFIEVNYPKGVYKTSWYTEVVYYKYGVQKGTASKLDFNAIKISSLAKARFIESTLKPYFLAGLSGTLPSDGSKFYVNNKQRAGELKVHWSLIVGTGIFITENLSAEFRVEKTSPLIFSNEKSKFGGTSIILGEGSTTAWLLNVSLAYRLNGK
jgi:hypothetical protein